MSSTPTQVYRDSISRIVVSRWPHWHVVDLSVTSNSTRHACQSPTGLLRIATLRFISIRLTVSLGDPTGDGRARYVPRPLIPRLPCPRECESVQKVRRSVYDCIRETRSMKRTREARSKFQIAGPHALLRSSLPKRIILSKRRVSARRNPRPQTRNVCEKIRWKSSLAPFRASNKCAVRKITKRAALALNIILRRY